MAQHDYSIANQSGAAFRSDLNNALAAIVSQNSGATAPSTTYAYQFWADTTNGLLKLRNAANSAWITLFQLDGEWSTLAVENGTAEAPSIYFKTSGTDTGFYSPGADQVAISTGGTSKLFVDSSGRVGIGTTSPQNKFVVSNSGAEGIEFIPGYTSNRNVTIYYNRSTSAYAQNDQIASAHIFRIASDSTQAAIIDSSGRLGIGTSSVSGLLHVRGDMINSYGLRLASTYGTGREYGFYFTGLNSDNFQIKDITANADRLVIDSSGRVGIGTTAPATNLEVRGGGAGVDAEARISSNQNGAFVSFAPAGSNTIRQYTIGSAVGGSLIFYDNTASTQRAAIDSSGRLLVGTSTALSNVQLGGSNFTPKFQVQGADANDSLFSITRTTAFSPHFAFNSGSSGNNVANNGGVGTIYFNGYDGTNYVNAVSIRAEVDGAPGAGDMPGRLVFSTTADGASSPTERMRITQAGFFKATNTAGYISATGSYHELRSSTDNSEAVIVSHSGTSGTQYGLTVLTASDQNDATRWFFKGQGATTERFTARSNGGLANYQANDVNLSDRNAKKDISPAAGTWDCIKEWEIVNYRYKDQPDDVNLNLGVIAQQVAESCPEVITVFQEAKEAKPAVLDEEGNEVEPAQEAQPERLGVKEQQMYWMAIKALQEAQVRIEALEAEVAALKAS